MLFILAITTLKKKQTNKQKQKQKQKQKREENDLLQCFDKTEKWRITKCSYLEKHILFSTFCSIDLYIRLHKNWKKEWSFDYYSLLWS